MSLTAEFEARSIRMSRGSVIMASALVLVAAFSLLQLPNSATLNRDTIWLIEVVEQMLAGKMLYRDVIETNPPMAALLYVPPVAIAQVMGASPELAVILYTLACAAAFTGLSTALLASAGWYRKDQLVLIGVGLFVVLGLMPQQVVAQREHFGLMAAVPFVLLVAMQISDAPAPGRALRLTVAAGAALSMCIKPHFALAFALPILHAVLAKRSLRPLLHEENLAAGALVMAFGVWAWFAFPDYFNDILPMLLETYLPYKTPLAEYAFSPLSMVFYVFVIVGAPALLHPFAGGLIATVLSSSAGFFAAFLFQGKGWSYHLCPAIQMLAVAVLLAQFPRGGSVTETPIWKGLRLTACGLVAVGMGMIFAKGPPGHDRLATALAAAPRPASALILTEHHRLIFPAVRQAGVAWASRTNGLWLAETTLRQLQADGPLSPERRASLDAAIATLRRWLREDLAAMRPDVVVFDTASFTDWERFAMQDPAFAALMTDYQLVDSFSETGGFFLKVYRRK